MFCNSLDCSSDTHPLTLSKRGLLGVQAYIIQLFFVFHEFDSFVLGSFTVIFQGVLRLCFRWDLRFCCREFYGFVLGNFTGFFFTFIFCIFSQLLLPAIVCSSPIVLLSTPIRHLLLLLVCYLKKQQQFFAKCYANENWYLNLCVCVANTAAADRPFVCNIFIFPLCNS